MKEKVFLANDFSLRRCFEKAI